jgi:hypothetical protein
MIGGECAFPSTEGIMADLITGDMSIDPWLEYYRPHFAPEVFTKICKRIREGNQEQQIHTLREVILGGFLACHGYEPIYEHEYDGQKPEWTIYKHGKLLAIAEVRNWAADAEIENDFRNWLTAAEPGTNTGDSHEVLHGKVKGIRRMIDGHPFVFTYEPDRKSPHFERILNRLYQELHHKFIKYKELAKRLEVSYIVGFVPQFIAGWLIQPQDVLNTLHGDDSKLFENFPEVSGVYCYIDGDPAGSYFMRYEPNPFAIKPLLNMPVGNPRPF